jgi:hypothetical protein
VELHEMQSVERFVQDRMNDLGAIQMIEAIRDKFPNIALIGYGVCYYAKLFNSDTTNA